MTDLDVYTVCDARYFPALVLLVSSLDQHAPDARLTVCDVGLDDAQRAWLAGRATLVDQRPVRRAVPTLHKAFAATLAPSGPILIIDADGMVVGDLAPLVDRVRAGKIVLAVDPKADRTVPAWASMFGLRAPLRSQTYCGAGTVLLDADRHTDFLQRWWEQCGVASEQYAEWKADPAQPLMHNDQDVMNALLMSEMPEGTVEHFADGQMVADFFMPRVRLQDRERLRFTGPGEPPLVIQCLVRAKPFLPEGGTILYGSAYTMAARAVLTREARRAAPGSALAPDRLVPWMRPGLPGWWRFRRRTVWIRLRKAVGRARARWLPHH